MMIMKRLLSLTTILVIASCAPAADTKTETAPEPTIETAPVYDAALAEKLGADQHGMRNYVLATLITGPLDAEITDEAERNALFRGHFANISKLAEDGKLVLAGPFIDAAPKRGLYIFNVATIAEAEALVQSDPAVAAGIFSIELDKYYGSAALVQLNDLHLRIQKAKVE